MATRNLTKVFIEIRNAERATRRRNAGTTEEEEAILKVANCKFNEIALHCVLFHWLFLIREARRYNPSIPIRYCGCRS